MEHDVPLEDEGAVVRLGAPALATVLLIVTIAAVLALPSGPTQTTTVVVAVVLQVALMITRGVILRRAARPVDWPVRWHQFTVMWGAMTGIDFLISTLGDDPRSTARALVVVGQQLLVALFVVVVLWLNENAVPPELWPRDWWPRRRWMKPRDPEPERPRTVRLVERPARGTPPSPHESPAAPTRNASPRTRGRPATRPGRPSR